MNKAVEFFKEMEETLLQIIEIVRDLNNGLYYFLNTQRTILNLWDKFYPISNKKILLESVRINSNYLSRQIVSNTLLSGNIRSGVSSGERKITTYGEWISVVSKHVDKIKENARIPIKSMISDFMDVIQETPPKVDEFTTDFVYSNGREIYLINEHSKLQSYDISKISLNSWELSVIRLYNKSGVEIQSIRFIDPLGRMPLNLFLLNEYILDDIYNLFIREKKEFDAIKKYNNEVLRKLRKAVAPFIIMDELKK